jgi:hypothetical protein
VHQPIIYVITISSVESALNFGPLLLTVPDDKNHKILICRVDAKQDCQAPNHKMHIRRYGMGALGLGLGWLGDDRERSALARALFPVLRERLGFQGA